MKLPTPNLILLITHKILSLMKRSMRNGKIKIRVLAYFTQCKYRINLLSNYERLEKPQHYRIIIEIHYVYLTLS